jgi:ABC-type uncharacterized transport system auxiliary subunit
MTLGRSIGRTIAASLFTCGIGACTSGAFDSELPTRHVYVLAAPQVQPSAVPVPVDLTVARPVARPGLDTDRIAVLYPDRRLEYFAGSRWGANTDVVVQALLVETLRNAGGLRNVQNDTASFGADFVLQSEIAHFEAQYGGSGGVPEVRVELVVTIGRNTERRPLATFIAAGRAQADSNTLSAIVAAFEAAYAQAARTLVDSTTAAIRSATTGTAPASAQNVESPVASISR